MAHAGESASKTIGDMSVAAGHPLPGMLDMAVPLWILTIRKPDGSPPDDWSARILRVSEVLAECGEAVLYKVPVPGRTAAGFNALAEAIALLSFCSGGVAAFGRTWVASEVFPGKVRGLDKKSDG
jgi:hypothetical protein